MKKLYLFLAAALLSSLTMAQIPVTSITVNPESYDLEKGYKSTLKVTVLPKDATDPSVTWSTSDATIVTVDNDGTIHYKKDGIATITATANDGSEVKGTCTVYAGQYVYNDTPLIEGYANSGIYTINNVWTSPVVHENQTIQIGTFNTRSEKAEKRIRITNFGAPKWSASGVVIDIKWFPANDSLYIMNKQLIGKKNGSDYDLYIAGRGYFSEDAANTSYIDRTTGTLYLDADYFYYKTAGASASKYARKTDVFQLKESGGPVTEVTLSSHSYDLEKGYTTTLQATVLPENATDPSIAWTSSDESKVKVDATGKLTYVSDGVAIIKATAKDGSGCKDSCVVYAGQFIYDNTRLIEGYANSGTYTINITSSKLWTEPFAHENQVFQIGTFNTRPEKADKRIRITNFGAPAWSASGVVIDIKWFPANDSLYIMNKQLIGVKNSDGYDVYIAGRGYFKSDGANTSYIDRATGTLYLDADYFYYKDPSTASSYTRKTDVFQLDKLGGPVTQVSINTHSIDLEKGYTATLKASVTPANATDPSIEWTSSDESKVKVDATGNLTYVSDGVAFIMATAKDGSGCKDSCTVYTGQYVFEDTTLVEGFLNTGTYTISTTIDELTPVTMKEQTIQVGSFNSRPEKAEKRIRITNFGAGSLTQDGVAIDIKWFTENDSLYIINKQLIGVKNASGRDINISGRGQFTSDAANTSHLDRAKGLLSLDADYFYYKEGSSSASSYKKLTDTLQLDIKKDIPYIIIADTKNAITIPTLGGESEPFLVRTNTTSDQWQVNLPDGYSYTATPANEDTVAITIKHEGYIKATYADTMAIAIESETLCKIAYKQNGIIIQYINEPIAEFWAEYEANSKFYYTAASDGKNYSLYHFYTPLKRADVEVSAPDWCEVNLRDSVYKEQNVLSLTMKAPEETQTERTGELKIQYKGEDILVYNLRQLGFHPYAKDIYSSQGEGGTVSGNGGQVKFMRYTNTEWLWKTNVDFAKWSVEAPEWIQTTLTARSADTVSLKMFVETKDYSVEGRTGIVTIKADTLTLTLTITQTAAVKSMSYYNVDGALYYGTSNNATAYTTQYMYVPYADSVAVVSQVGPGTWYGGKNHAIDSSLIGSDTYWVYSPSNVNNYVMYMPYFQSEIKDLYNEWQWGGVIKYRANARMRIGTGKKAYLCAPQYHPDSLASDGKTSDMYMRSGTFSGQSIHYCYGTKVGNEEQGYYDSIGTYIHTNGVVWADSIYLPIYNYAINKEGAPQEKATIFGENGKVTLTIYPATSDADGYPVVDREHPMYEVTADSTNFLWNGSTAYKGAITFVKTEKNPLGIEEVVPFISDGGDFYIEFTGFNESGVDFGLYSNGYAVAGQENGKGWFYKNGEYKKVWGKQYSLYITLYGFFPFIKTMYGAEEINVNVMGDEVSILYPELEEKDQIQSDLLIRANRDFGEWEIENPDWVTLNFDTTEIWDASNFIDITFEVEPNDGPEREGEIVLTNHGVSKFITIKQEADASGFINLFDRKDQKNVDKLLKNGNIIIRRDNETFTIDGRKLE